MPKRPPIPADLERAVLVEAGHRCAIPVCRQVPVEIAHIVKWTRRKKHEFHNLIALCPTCHTRFDSGEIDFKSMTLYKRQLAVTNRRYGDLELRVLQTMAVPGAADEFALLADLELLLDQLLADGLLVDTGRDQVIVAGGGLVRKVYKLTKAGRDYIVQYFQPAKPK